MRAAKGGQVGGFWGGVIYGVGSLPGSSSGPFRRRLGRGRLGP